MSRRNIITGRIDVLNAADARRNGTGVLFGTYQRHQRARAGKARMPGRNRRYSRRYHRKSASKHSSDGRAEIAVSIPTRKYMARPG